MHSTFSTRTRLLLICGFMTLLAGVLFARSFYLASSDLHQDRTNLMLMTRVPHSLSQLEAQHRKIDEVASSIDSYSLKEIKAVLSETSRIAQRAGTELGAQSEAWDEIRAKASIDASAYRELQKNLGVASRMQSAEIIRLNQLLKDSTELTFFGNVFALASSFFLGVISSIAATILHDRYKAWRGRKKARA